MLLHTKFLAPAYNAKSVERTRLIERLTPRKARKLILISAPAGYGKTTLVSQYLHNGDLHNDGLHNEGLKSHDRTFCWLSLDHTDSEQIRFWRYLVGSIGTVIENFGAEAQHFLTTPSVHAEAAVTAMVNELYQWSQGGTSLTIVLDDFHVIQDNETLRLFAYFVDFLPAKIELLVTSRFEPRLPIARWSVKNWVDQIYASDLIFSYPESKLFFNHYMGLALSDKQIEHLCHRTEGWIAAMQLAALSASATQCEQQKDIPTEQLFADDRHISDYILSEILEHQAPQVKNFLLDTACLLRLSGKLCDSIREQSDSQEILEYLFAANLFVTPLDKDNQWFRYHDMFRESLLNKARTANPEKLMQLQSRAISWLIEHDQPHEAIEQVVQLKDWALLVSLLEKHGNNLIHEGHHLPMLYWLSLLPPEFTEHSPRIVMLKIWALFFSNKIEVIQPLLDEVERLIDNQRLKNVETSIHELIDLHSEISLIRSYLARTHSDLTSASKLTKQVLEELDNTNMPLKSVTYYGIGLDCFTVGDLDSAEAALIAAIDHGKRERKYTTVLSSSGLLGWIYFYQGKMAVALEIGIQNQQWNVSYNDPTQPRVISCWQNTVLAMIYIEKAEFTIAESYINPLLKHIETGTEPSLHIIIQYTYGCFLYAQKRYADAIVKVDDALRVYQHKKEFIAFEPPSLSALKAKCLLAMGKIDKAQYVIDELDSDTITAVPLNFEDINLTKARIFTAQGKFALVLEMLDRLIQQTQEKNHVYHLIQALIIKAIALFKMHDAEQATRVIGESLALAAQDGFISVYTNEPPIIEQVLALCSDPTLPDVYLQKLTRALGLQASEQPKQNELPGAAALESNKQLLEPLSTRELEVLKLIDLGLANKVIAQKLFLAPATVKAHIRNLYGKLDAKSRTEALAKARNLGLL